MAVALVLSGIVFWACAKEKDFSSGYDSQKQKGNLKWGIDSTFAFILSEELHLLEKVQECQQELDINHNGLYISNGTSYLKDGANAPTYHAEKEVSIGSLKISKITNDIYFIG